MARRLSGRTAGIYFGFWVFLWLAAVPGSFGDNLIPDRSFRVWLEPTFMRSPLTAPVRGAKMTVKVGGFQVRDALKPAAKSTLETLGLTWEQFEVKARNNAADELAKLQPRYERDARKSIVYAALESESPIVACAVLAPGFLDLFKETLGDKVLVVVPNQCTAYVFPRLASDYLSYSPMVLRANRESSYPVSLEVFEVSSGGWRCLGAYGER